MFTGWLKVMFWDLKQQLNAELWFSSVLHNEKISGFLDEGEHH